MNTIIENTIAEPSQDNCGLLLKVEKLDNFDMRTHAKMQDLSSLPSLISELKKQGRKVVHCHGVFDLLHIGHIRYFEAARKMGEVLVVTVTPDRYVNKGPNRPAFTEVLRGEAIASLSCVDFVAINKWPTAVETIRLLKPNFYVKGSEYRNASDDITGGIALEKKAIQEVGGELAFTEEITFSSSELINQNLPIHSPQIRNYLDGFSKKFNVSEVVKYLANAKTLRVLIVGESIIDEYQYCQTMGKSGKEPILAAKLQKCEKFAGGILAVANHVGILTEKIKLVTFLGQRNSHEEFIEEKLNPFVDRHFLRLDEGPTIVKRRFVENYPFQKLFEVYEMAGDEYRPGETKSLCDKLKEVLPLVDVVIVTDYGHGMIGPEAVELLCTEAPFLAINTQVNAGNRGFNTVSKYSRADYICVSEQEIRLEVRNRLERLEDIVEKISKSMSCDNILITRGEKGSLVYNAKEGFSEIPAFRSHTVDRVGAGDAVFGLTSLCVAQNAPMEMVGYIGNVIGAQAVGTVGNREAIDRVQLEKSITHMLK
jgi:rfaE bifunctional protein kinase chain/domain/rfaE bifunctional protein nucleotidyltransferase chain/domain